MGDATAIEWTDATWNALAGCSVTSPACKHCYAMKLAGRLAAMGQDKYKGLTVKTKAGFVFNGTVRLDEAALGMPLRWRRPRRIFVNSMSDLFHEAVPDAWIDRIFAVMALAPHHTFQVLTKRSDRMRSYFSGTEADVDRWHVYRICQAIDELVPMRTPESNRARQIVASAQPLPNVWLGVTAEDQKRWDERVRDLGDTPAAVRWVSVEPMLGDIDVGNAFDHATTSYPDQPEQRAVDWVICGGESGPGARPMHPAWARSLRDQCRAWEVPFFFKQWGDWLVAERDRSTHAWARYVFPDGDAFHSVSEANDIVIATAEEHRGAPQRVFQKMWGSGDGHLMKRAGAAAGRQLDGITHDAFPGVGQ